MSEDNACRAGNRRAKFWAQPSLRQARNQPLTLPPSVHVLRHEQLLTLPVHRGLACAWKRRGAGDNRPCARVIADDRFP